MNDYQKDDRRGKIALWITIIGTIIVLILFIASLFDVFDNMCRSDIYF